MTDFLAELRAELLAAESDRDRARQLEAGASQTFGCRADLVMLANGVDESDPHLGWQAWVGNAIHERLAGQLTGGDRWTERRLTYRGVPCTIDRYDPPPVSAVVDWKTKDTAGDVAVIRRDGPKRSSVAQVMLGAAAVIEAGQPVQTVRLVYLPRAGTLDDAYVWEAPFDRAIADEAAEWHEKLRALVSERIGLSPPEMADGLRDQPESWCRQWCARVSLCRGPAPDLPVMDAAVGDIAAEYLDARSLRDEADARMAKARGFLLGRNGVAAGYQVTTTGGRDRRVESVDVDALIEGHRFVFGDEVPVPMKVEVKVTPQQLRVTKARETS